MRLYLDCCCLNRPFDDLRHGRIRIEADAIASILARIDRGDWHLIGSHVLSYEISRTPDIERQRACIAMASRAVEVVALTGPIRIETARLVGLGLKPLDAAHVASAEAGKADCFLTVDDVLLRKARAISNTLTVRVDSPVTFLLGQGEGEDQ